MFSIRAQAAESLPMGVCGAGDEASDEIVRRHVQPRGVAPRKEPVQLLHAVRVQRRGVGGEPLRELAVEMVEADGIVPRAAEELHLSQPTVSKQVSSLENEIGGTLFIRTTREVALTALGESFLRDACEILRLTYAAGERARREVEVPVHLLCVAVREVARG